MHGSSQMYGQGDVPGQGQAPGGGYGAPRYVNGGNNGQGGGAPMDMSGNYGGGGMSSGPMHNGSAQRLNPGGLNELEQVIISFETTPNVQKLKQKVCVHWLKNVCRKGNQCEYLHRYVEDKIPICRFFKERGHCD